MGGQLGKLIRAPTLFLGPSPNIGFPFKNQEQTELLPTTEENSTRERNQLPCRAIKCNNKSARFAKQGGFHFGDLSLLHEHTVIAVINVYIDISVVVIRSVFMTATVFFLYAVPLCPKLVLLWLGTEDCLAQAMNL